MKEVAERLGNTPAISRKCYIHPAVVEAFLDRSLAARLTGTGTAKGKDRPPGLAAEEWALMRLLHQRQALVERHAA